MLYYYDMGKKLFLLLGLSIVFNLCIIIGVQIRHLFVGVVHFGVTLVGAIMATLPMPYEGLAGMPRRYFDYGHFVELDRAGIFVSFETKILLLMILAQILFVVNMIFSAIRAMIRRC